MTNSKKMTKIDMCAYPPYPESVNVKICFSACPFTAPFCKHIDNKELLNLLIDIEENPKKYKNFHLHPYYKKQGVTVKFAIERYKKYYSKLRNLRELF